MKEITIFLFLFVNLITLASSDDVLGCGGFVQSHVHIDFSKVEVKLLTKNGILKDKTNCAPNNGYYFLPLYDKGEYTLELNPPPGWSFTPMKVDLLIDGSTDACTQGRDLNFVFTGFGITGKVESLGDSSNGPNGVTVELHSATENRTTKTTNGGLFFFTPVFPGIYTLSISHPRWKIHKGGFEVKVTEGNTELPPNSLIVHGYNVKGLVKSDGQPVIDTTVLLFQHKDNKNSVDVDGCTRGPVVGLESQNKPLCYLKSDKKGIFTFGSIPVGKYFLQPFYSSQNIDFAPASIEVNVQHSDVELTEHFEIIGFTISGHVLKSGNIHKPHPLGEAKIFVNGKLATQTDATGFYKLDKLKTGSYKIKAESNNLMFEETIFKISPNMHELPTIFPSHYKICGRIVSDVPQTINVVGVGSTFYRALQSESGSGLFCEYLPHGFYEVQVSIKENEKAKGLQFYPISHKLEVFEENLNFITFTQLKATISGKVQCFREEDCKGLKILLRPDAASGNERGDIIVVLTGNTYTFNDIFPGNYELLLSSNKYCWTDEQMKINVNTLIVNAPNFVQTGYAVNIMASHETKVLYNIPDNNVISTILATKGRSTHCLPKYGLYNFQLQSCHTFASSSVSYHTDSEPNEVYLNAVKHLNKICISAESKFGDVNVTIEIEGEKTQIGPLPFDGECFTLELSLAPDSEASITPESDIFYFQPLSTILRGKKNCSDFGAVFQAIKGHIYKGHVTPVLAGVLISLESDTGEKFVVETDNDGLYKFPLMDESKGYKITAKKDSYVFLGPTDDGTFTAHKLAEVIVEVLDASDQSPLQGALLSLSGGLSYRSNLQTNELGKITFHSLSPSEYYLRPMMKEYNFEPSSKIINLKEGQTVEVTLIGKRVAYSAYGQITSLNNGPEVNVMVEAAGLGPCSHYSEETTTEANGHFRVRGLQPSCSYRLIARSAPNEEPLVERSIPEFIEIKEIKEDIKNLKLIVLRPRMKTKTLVRVYSENPEYYRTLRLKVFQKGVTPTLTHNIKVDTANGKIDKEHNQGVLMYIPSLPADGKSYSLQLESSAPATVKWHSQSGHLVANSSFKFIELEFTVKNNTSEHHIKQTSIWTLGFIFVSLIVAYNIESSVRLFGDRFNFDVSSIKTFFMRKSNNAHVVPFNVDDTEILRAEALKKKVKSRKT